MKSLIRKNPVLPSAWSNAPRATPANAEVAQCCAKISKTVAGCHD